VDQAQSTATWTMGAGIEILLLAGAAAINGTGNSLANLIQGNGAANVLDGGDGADTLIGAAGADTMEGGAGNDVFIVDNTADVASDSAGVDQAQSTATWTMGAGIEILLLAGAAAINGTGNTLANVIQGNGAANVLDGVDGNDSLAGLGGGDVLLGGAGNDTISGGDGADTINGGAGLDVLLGGTGGDAFVYVAATDSTAVLSDQIGSGADLFTPGSDRVDVSAIDPDAVLAGDQAFTWGATFVAGTYVATFTTQPGAVQLRFDMNADGIFDPNDMRIIVVGLTTFSAADIVL